MNRGRNVPLLTAIVATLVALGLCALHLWVRPLPGLDAFEGFAIDARFKVRGPRAPATDRVVIVGLDDDTRRQYPEIFQTRRGFADLFRALTKYDVKVIALDLFFNAPEVLLPEDLEAEVRDADKELATIIASPEPSPAPPGSGSGAGSGGAGSGGAGSGGAGSGAGSGGAGSGAGSGGAGSGAGSGGAGSGGAGSGGANAGSGASAASGAGSASGAGAGKGSAAGSGAGASSGAGAGVGSGSGSGAGNKAGAQPDNKTTDKAGTKPGDKAGAKPGDKAGAKPGDKAGAKPGDKAGAKPDDKTLAVTTDKTAPPATPPTPAKSLEQSRWELAQIVHSIAEEMRGDEMLAKAITDTKRIFLGAYFRAGKGKAREKEPVKLALARHGESADSGSGGARRPLHAVAVNFTLDEIGGGAIGAGALNAFRDPDGVTRRMPLAIEFGDRHYLPMGLSVALYDLGKTGDTRYLAGESTMKVGGRTLPVGAAASITLDVLGKERIPTISAADVMSGKAPAASLKNKLVFVGMTYASYDKVQTPLDQVANGVELHATLAENFLSGHILGQAGPLTTLLAGLLLCGFVIAAQLRPLRRRAWVPPLVAAAAIAAYLAIAQVMFAAGTMLAVAAPIAMAFVVLAAATIGGLATEGREKAHLRSMFSRYVSRSVVDRLLADPKRAKLGGERKELTVLFSDIRGFSAFSEGMGPEELANFIGEYLTPMTELVLESGGTLDKYIGDAVMAIWAAPVHLPDHADRACDVALKMHAELIDLNRRWKTEGKPEIAIGIGLNTGPMSVGNMGTPARFDYTVLGDQVNLGARLEALTKEYGVDILVGEGTKNAASNKFVFREVDVVRVKGRAGAAPVFELVGRAHDGAKVDKRFVEAIAAYRRRSFSAARIQFEALAATDKTSAIFAKRCAALAENPPPPDWDGVYDQKSK